ncbi:uncharacterized protein LOC133669522 [Populus nigra]|uniref:uncharacterized protein LOC133669522 n=1 Tax=Populus nigra TaxID=3691 RepID=UPI002B26879A|nr:uncharacterized protein LOC133669522 [Populus nigra]
MSRRPNFQGGRRGAGGVPGRGGDRGRGRGGRDEQRWWDPVWRAERLRQKQSEMEVLDEDEWWSKMEQMKAAQKKTPVQIVRLDNAFKMAGLWVNNMSKAVEDEPAEVESEGRPSRLGLGAKEVPRHSKARLSNDPVERRLYAKLEAGKRRAAKIIEDSIVPARDCNEDDDSDGESESRTSTFAKKRPGPQVQSLQVKKKQK